MRVLLVGPCALHAWVSGLLLGPVFPVGEGSQNAGWHEKRHRGTDLQQGLCGQTANGLRNCLSMSERKRERKRRGRCAASKRKGRDSLCPDLKLTVRSCFCFVIPAPSLSSFPSVLLLLFMQPSSSHVRTHAHTLAKKQSPTIPLPILHTWFPFPSYLPVPSEPSFQERGSLIELTLYCSCNVSERERRTHLDRKGRCRAGAHAQTHTFLYCKNSLPPSELLAFFLHPLLLHPLSFHFVRVSVCTILLVALYTYTWNVHL